MSTIAVYPGSFDPPTNGHLNLIERGLKVFDKLIVVVSYNPQKKPIFTPEERVDMMKTLLHRYGDQVEVDSLNGLLINYCKERDIRIVLRGLRAVSDFEYEFQMANMNRTLHPGMETVFIMTGEDYFYISARLVWEVASLGGDVSQFVPQLVEEKLRKKLGR